MDIDYSTPRTALHSLKEGFLNTRMGRPFAKKRDGKASAELMRNRLNGEMPAGIQAVIDGITNFNEIKY